MHPGLFALPADETSPVSGPQSQWAARAELFHLARVFGTEAPTRLDPGDPRNREEWMIAIEETDEMLVGFVLAGNRDKFSVLVDRYKRGIANFIGASVRSQADIADLTQETFLRAFAHLGTFNPELGKFSTWVYHIARNVVRTFLGKSLRRPLTTDLGEERTVENALPDVSLEADPAGGVLRAEAEAEVRAALAELPERTRTVLALRYYDNMDYQTIATTMGLSLGNVKTLIHRGKLALAHKLKEREEVATLGVGRKSPLFGGFHELQFS